MFNRNTGFLLLLLVLGLLLPLSAQALSTAFTYQGRLTQAGAAPTGAVDLQFTLYDAALLGTPVGTLVTLTGVPVTKGLFTVALDFGSASFQGNDRWLEIAVKPAGGETYTTLSPRQQLTPTPYALFARGVSWADIVGRPLTFGVYQAGSGLTLTGNTFSISTGAITDSMITGLAWSKITGAPSSFAPSGTAGGDLTGTYPNPTVGSGKIDNTKLAADAASLTKVSGGNLAVSGSNVGVGTALPATKLDVVGTVKMTGFQLGASATAGQILTASATGVGTWQTLSAILSGSAAGGDLTGTYPNPTIATSAVTTAKIADMNVTTVKIADANVTTAKIADSAVTSVKIADGTVANVDLASDSASLAKVSGGNVTVSGTNVGVGTATPTTKLDVNGTAKITGFQLGSSATVGQVLATNATGVGAWTDVRTLLGAASGDLTGTYPSPTIATSAVTTAKIADANVTNAKLAANAVTTANIADANVTTAKLADNAVTAAKIADGAVANADLASDSASLAKVSGGVMSANTIGVSVGPAGAANKLFQVSRIAGAGIIAQQTSNNMLCGPAGETWQSFTPTTDALLTQVVWLLATDTAITAKVTIYAGEGTAGAVLTSQIVSIPVVPQANFQVTLTTPVPVAAGQVYTVLLGSPSGMYWVFGSTADTYAGGKCNLTGIVGDLYFKCYSASAGQSALSITPDTLLVGIGTTTPAATLDVNGTAKMVGFQLGSSATAGQVLATNATGVGAWTDVRTLLGAAGGDLTGTYPSPTIATSAVTTTKIADANVTTAKIADANVTTAKIADANVTTVKIADANVTTAKIADSAITTAKIADGAVANADLASDAASLAKVSGGVMTSTGSAVGLNTTADAGYLLDANGDAELGTKYSAPQDTLAVSDQQFFTGYAAYTDSGSLGQSFTAGVTGALARILVRSWGNTNNATLTLYQGEGTGGTVLCTVTNVTLTTAGWQPILLPALPSITAGQKYTFIIAASGRISLYIDTSNGYAGGKEYTGGNINATFDLSFQTYVITGTPKATRALVAKNGVVGIHTDTPGAGLALDVNGTAKMTGFQLDASATAGQVLTTDATGTGTWQDITLAQATGGLAAATATDITITQPATNIGQPVLNLKGDLYCTDTYIIGGGGGGTLNAATATATGTMTSVAQSISMPGTGYLESVSFRAASSFTTATLNIYSGDGVGGTLLYTQPGIRGVSDGDLIIPMTTPVAITQNSKLTFQLVGTGISLYLGSVIATGTFYNGSTADTTRDLSYQVNYISTYQSVEQPTLVTRKGNVGIGIGNPMYKLQVNGIVAGTSAYLNTSDSRFKTNVNTFVGALDTVKRLRGVRFDWNAAAKQSLNADNRQHLGFIAQEVQQVLPQVVFTGADGNLSLAYGDVVPVLVEAMKEQQTQIDKLQANNAALEARLAKLEARMDALNKAGN